MYSEALGRGKSAAGQATGGPIQAPNKSKQASAGQATGGPIKSPIKIKQASGGSVKTPTKMLKAAGASSGGTETPKAADCTGTSITSRGIEEAEAGASSISSGGINAVTAATPGSASNGPEVYDIKEVAKSFITSYYKILQEGPQYLFRFHGEDTEFCHHGCPFSRVVGIEKIKERLALLNYANSRVEIRSLDAFESVGKTITVLVLGQMTIKFANWRPFVHTMILVLREPNTQKYYLKTDSLRFLI